jgi:large subunit ribosomal protein L6
MSRVGKMPIVLPKGAEATIAADQITVKGPLGTLTQRLTGLVLVKNDNGTLTFEAANDSREANAMSGTLPCVCDSVQRCTHGVVRHKSSDVLNSHSYKFSC